MIYQIQRILFKEAGIKIDPSHPTGTLPKSDELNIESAYRFFIVGFGEGRVGQACAVQVFPAMESEHPDPDVFVERGRY